MLPSMISSSRSQLGLVSGLDASISDAINYYQGRSSPKRVNDLSTTLLLVVSTHQHRFALLEK